MKRTTIVKKLPLKTDAKIRTCLLCMFLRRLFRYLTGVTFRPQYVLVPFAVFLVFFGVREWNGYQVEVARAELIQNVHERNAQEVADASQAIYHLKQVIEEGSDKPEFVAQVLGVATSAPKRIDTVETWQHSNNALARVESTGLTRSFQTFLSLERDGHVHLFHYGPEDETLQPSRAHYDEAHDLGSLYAAFASTSKPDIFALPENAELKTFPDKNENPIFVLAQDNLEIEFEVDRDSLLVVSERIFVIDGDDRYEMTTIKITERSIEPAEEFDTIFDTEEFDYEQIAITAV